MRKLTSEELASKPSWATRYLVNENGKVVFYNPEMKIAKVGNTEVPSILYGEMTLRHLSRKIDITK